MGGDFWLHGQMVTRRGLTAVCVGLCVRVCVHKRREIGTDCVQHLSSLDMATKEKKTQHQTQSKKQREGKRRTE